MRLALIVLLALALPSAARAEMPPSAFDRALTRSLAIAERQWGADACTGRVRIEMTTFAALGHARNDLVPTAIADATQATCTVRLARDRVDTRAQLCAWMMHERGHLHGLLFENPADSSHSLDPLSVMAPAVNYAPAVCIRSFPSYDVKMLRHQHWACAPTLDWTWRCKRQGRYTTLDAI